MSKPSPKPTVPKMSLTVSSAPSAAFRTPSPSPSLLSLWRLLSVSHSTVSFIPSYQSPSVPLSNQAVPFLYHNCVLWLISESHLPPAC